MVFTLFLNAFEGSLVWTIFQVQQDYIANNLCVNRDRPQVMCNGKCVLAEQLKQTQEQDQNSPFSIGEYPSSDYYTPLIINNLNSPNSDRNQGIIPFYIRRYQADYLDGTFRPPPVLS